MTFLLFLLLQTPMTQTQARLKMDIVCGGERRGYAWEIPRYVLTAARRKITVTRRYLGCESPFTPNQDPLYGGPLTYAAVDGSWEDAFADLVKRHPRVVVP